MTIRSLRFAPTLLAFLSAICMALSACSSQAPAQDDLSSPSQKSDVSNLELGQDSSESQMATTKISHTDTQLEASFSRGKAAATIMIIKAPRHPGFIAEPGIDSPYESDHLVLNRDGDLLFAGFGGAEAMDKGWNKYLEVTPEHVDALERHSDLFLARDAAQSLALDPTVGPQFKWALEAAFSSINETIRQKQLTDPGR